MGLAPASTPIPADMAAAIAETKATLRARIGDVAGAFADLSAWMAAEVAEVVQARDAGEDVFPIVAFADVQAGTVSEATRVAITRRGCAVVRGTFPRPLAESWNDELGRYLDDNRFLDRHQLVNEQNLDGPAATKRPSIFPVYWSKPQVLARQHAHMATVRSFLNGFWTHESEGQVWFDPTKDAAYIDRIRRREPASEARGLAPHTDSGSVERWLLPAYQRVFRHVFSGAWRAYDPWDGAYRTEILEFQSTVMCSAFRTFQGWTALSEMRPEDGVLHAIPIPSAMAFVLLRALQDDIAADDLCGATNGRGLAASARYHELLLPALSPIPAVEPGDTVWWHADLIHAVGEASTDERWGNVMYIPAAPWCEKNAEYARVSAGSFLAGTSPVDFAADDFEVGWNGRATVDDLDATGRRQLSLEPW